jgi:hypothetical protein
MHTAASLDPERCIQKSDHKAKNLWVANQIRQLGHYEDVNSPTIHTQEEYMEEDINMGDIGQGNPQPPTTEIPPGSSEAPPTGAIGEGTTTTGAPTQGGTMLTGVTRLRLGTPEPTTLPIKEGGGTNTGNISVEHSNKFAALRQQGANSGEQGSPNLSSGILRGGSTSASSSRGSRGREPIPLTPEILQLLGRLEPRGSKRGSSRSISQVRGPSPPRSRSYRNC